VITVSAPTHTHAKPKLNPSPLASSRLYALRRISQHPPTYVLSTYAGRVVSSSCIMVGRRYIFQETTYVRTSDISTDRHRHIVTGICVMCVEQRTVSSLLEVLAATLRRYDPPCVCASSLILRHGCGRRYVVFQVRYDFTPLYRFHVV
jgi:hypothetical protein